MNKNAIKKFAISARTRLIATVSDKAGTLGITKEGISEPSSKGNGFEVYKTSAGTEVMLQGNQMEQRRRLVAQVNARGFDVVMEEVAYTWFNRICAIRFMEVNDYLPSRIRVLSSLKEGKNEPDLLTEAPNVDLDLSEKDREWIINAKAENRLDELFSMLFIKQCNKLSEILPELFEATQDYTEMLLNLSYTNKDDVIRMLVDGVDEKDFNVTTPDENGKPTGQVEIIGWLYQYYNTELKDDTFAQLKKNVKISKERIPAATQLFTPDWIVRYMVENSVGRIWIEHLRALNPDIDEKDTAESFGWKYYLPEAEQDPEVNTELAEIRKSYADIKPEDILCIDPCMGSGHIIVAMFDVLMDIYKSVGYGERDAAFEIVEHNLHGLDIDKRAYQLAYFAVMMKGRQYNRRFFRGKNELRPQPKVYAFVESNDVNRAQLAFLGTGLNEIEKNNAITQINGLLDTFKNAREYGSILNVDRYDWDLLRRFISMTYDEGQMNLEYLGLDQTRETIHEIVNIGEVMAKKYNAAVTNPPYMGGSGINDVLVEYLKEHYSNSKSDLFAVFIEKTRSMLKKYAFSALITMESWMFLSSFERMRVESNRFSYYNAIHMPYLGKGGTSLGISFGTIAFVQRALELKAYKGRYQYIRYYETDNNGVPYEFPTINERYNVSSQEDYEIIPGCPMSYWVDRKVYSVYLKGKTIKDYGEARQGIATGENERFLRCWYEPIFDKVALPLGVDSSAYKWIPYHKGGEYRKWYGNNDFVVNWENDGYEIKHFIGKNGKLKSRPQNLDYALKSCITWSLTNSSAFGARFRPDGFMFDINGMSLFVDERLTNYTLGYLCSRVANYFMRISNPTFASQAGDIARLPFVLDNNQIDRIDRLVSDCIAQAKDDWDSFETSWDFACHPILPLIRDANSGEYDKQYLIADRYKAWEKECSIRFRKVKDSEEELNSIFIEIYGLQGKLIPEVDEKDITIRKADLRRDVRSLISYIVGCMFGRYSHLLPGLVYAGGEWPPEKKSICAMEQYSAEADPLAFSWTDIYGKYVPDLDNIIPITDEEYFEDDIVTKFVEFIKVIYGADTLEENLDYIARALGNKGDTSREVIRYYFLNDFFKDHCNTYSVAGSGKRPIYWLFDSGRQNGFKALIYMHRYDQDTVGRVRTEYLHKTQKAIEQAMKSAQYSLDNCKSGTEKSKATKRLSKYTKQLAEIQLYDEAIAHIANQRIALDLDDGVKVNYEKFQGVEVSREGMKTVKVDLLARI